MVNDIVNLLSEFGNFFERLYILINSYSPICGACFSLFLAFLAVFVPLRLVRRLLGE